MESTKLWVNKAVNLELLYEFIHKGFFTPLLAKILINKGFSDIQSAYSFLYPQISDFSDPFLIPDMLLAVKRIAKALKSREKIGIYGDSDADGIIGSFVLYNFLKELTSYVEWLIPNKEVDGYGFHAKYLPFFKNKGVSLIITVDVGISDYYTANLAKATGIDVIITDHHEVFNKPYTITVTGKLTPSFSPFYHLCGTGVVFALIRALRTYLYYHGFFREKRLPYLRKYMELVCLATLADMVPLRGENRIITFFGFRDFLNSSFPAIQVLLEKTNLNNSLSEEDLYYRIIPKINSAARLGYPEKVFYFLSSPNKVIGEKYFEEIEKLNQKRQEIEKEILKSIETHWSQFSKSKNYIFLTFENIPKGLLGLIANRFKTLYQLPTIVISCEKETVYGSIRSPSEINFFEIFSKCKDLLIQFGGHKYALGFKLDKKNLSTLKARLENLLESHNFKPLYQNLIYIDAEATLLELFHKENLFAFHQFHPYGEDHSPCMILLKNFSVKNFVILKEKHSKLILQQGDKELIAMYFNNILEKNKINLIVGTPYINNFTQNLEFKIEDVK